MAPAHVTTVCDYTPQQLAIARYATEILFGPGLYQHYIGWQSSLFGYGGARFPGDNTYKLELQHSADSNVLGNLPSLHHYHCFTEFMLKAGSRIVFPRVVHQEESPASVNDQASEQPERMICGHRLHPGNTHTIFVACPSCHIGQNIRTLAQINATWQLFKKGSSEFSRLQGIWHYQKRQWRYLVDVIEDVALQEERWEFEQLDKGMDITRAVAGTSRCSEALKEAHKCPNMVEGWGASFVPTTRRRSRIRNCYDTSCNHLRNDSSPSCRQVPASLKNSDRGAMSPPPTKGNRHFGLGGRCTRSVSPTPCTAVTAPKSSSRRQNLNTDSLEYSNPSSPDSITISPPRDVFTNLHTSRNRVLFAESAVDNVIRREHQYSRSSVTYEPGRHACRREYEWLDPHNYPSSETEDDDLDDHAPGYVSDDEDLGDEDATCEDIAISPEILGTYTDPSLVHGDSRVKRRRLNDHEPANATGSLQGPENAKRMITDGSHLDFHMGDLSLSMQVEPSLNEAEVAKIDLDGMVTEGGSEDPAPAQES